MTELDPLPPRAQPLARARGNPESNFLSVIAVTASAGGRFMTTRWVYAYVLVEVVLALAVSAVFRSSAALWALDPLLFFPVFAFHLYHRRSARLVGLVSLWGIWKSVLFMAFVWSTGDYMDSLISGAAAYHADTLGWITSGEGKIAHPEIFIPEHLWRLWHVALTAVASCGLTTLIGGARELNIMNFHVAKLLQSARDPWTIIFFGWPIWSLLRGWAYLCITMGMGRLFFCIVKRRRPEYRRLCVYLLIGCALAGVDLGLKILLAPSWRKLILSGL